MFFLRRHKIGETNQYWYEVREKGEEFPLAVSQERSVCVIHSEETGRIIVDELNIKRRAGLEEGIRRFAWWKDGVQYVGTCGTTLEQALKDLDTERIY